jgi:hypothetical protein
MILFFLLGYFTCLVKAGTPELAVQNFKHRIQLIKEDIIEIADREYKEAAPFLRFTT